MNIHLSITKKVMHLKNWFIHPTRQQNTWTLTSSILANTMGENGKMDYSYIVNISVVNQKYYNGIGRFPKSTLTSQKIKHFSH